MVWFLIKMLFNQNGLKQALKRYDLEKIIEFKEMAIEEGNYELAAFLEYYINFKKKQTMSEKLKHINSIEPQFRAKIYDAENNIIGECSAAPDSIAYSFEVCESAEKIHSFGRFYKKGHFNPSYALKHKSEYKSYTKLF